MSKNTITSFGAQVRIVIILIIGIFFSFTSAQAATTIGADITTDGNISTTAGYLRIGLFASDPLPGVSADGELIYNTAINKFRCFENGAWKDCISSVTGGSVLSSLTAAVAPNIINNGANAQTWNWELVAGTDVGLKFGETNNSLVGAAGSAIVEASALSNSNSTPLRVVNKGTAPSFIVGDSAGDLTPALFVDSETAMAAPFNHPHVAIGTNSFNSVAPETLLVDSGDEPSYNIIHATGNLDNYLQINIQNRNSGFSASSDVVATSDNGDENKYYIDMGINSQGYGEPDYNIGGPSDAYLLAQGDDEFSNGGNLSIGTGTVGKTIKFHTGGSTSTDEKARITGDALILQPYDIVATSTLNLKFAELAANGVNFVGFKAPDSITADKVWTLPAADGAAGYALVTDGGGNLGWASASSLWQNPAGTLSPLNGTDAVTTSGDIYTSGSGDIYTSGTGTITTAGLLTGSLGATVLGAPISLNDNSNFNTTINTGASTGAVTIGNAAAGAIGVTSGAALTLIGGATSTWGTSTGNLNLAVNGPATGNVQIGSGTPSSAPDLLVLDNKTDAEGALAGTNGAMYYNASTNKFRCYVSGAWGDCASAALSSLSAATALNSINNGDYAQTWNWSLTTDDKAAFTFGENTASNTTAVLPNLSRAAILNASTMASSEAIPLYVRNLGDNFSFRVDDEGSDTTPFIINEEGNVMIGTTVLSGTYPEKLKVDSGDSGNPTIISAGADLNNVVNMNIQNRSDGSGALTVVGALADNGTSMMNNISMGIASSGFSSPIIYPIIGANDTFLISTAKNMIVGTTSDYNIKFITGDNFLDSAERMTIDSIGNVGIGMPVPGSKLDVKGTLRLSGSTSGYVGLASAAAAGSTTYTLPIADGTGGQSLTTNGSGVLYWETVAGQFQRIGTTVSPNNDGDDITTSGDIYTSGTGAITSAGLLTGNAGLDAKGNKVALNHNSNFDTDINTGTSTGLVNIGNSTAGAITVTSGSALTLTAGAASSFSTTAGDITIQPAGSGTTANVQIGAGGLGSVTPDYFALDVKSTTGDPLTGAEGQMYYNTFDDSFRCYIGSSWGACDTTGGTATLQSAYTAGTGAISTSSGKNIAFILNNTDQFTASGTGSVNLTPTGASSFTSGGALTLTGGAASTWSTSAGALTLTSATAATWGTSAGDLTLQVAGSGATGKVHIGSGTASAVPDLLSLDILAIGNPEPGGSNGDMYYSNVTNTFRCYEAGGWKDCGATAASATTLQQAYTSGQTINLNSGNLTVSGVGAVNLTPTAASQFTSAGVLTLTGGAASTWGTSSGNLTLQAGGAGTANVQIGTGGAGSATPDLFGVDVKSTATDPTGFNGAIYYNATAGPGNVGRFRCYEAGAWKDCDAGVVASLQTAYDNGGSVTTSGTNPIAFTLSDGNFNVLGAGSATLDPTGGVNLGSATSAVKLPGLTASSSVFTDASNNLTSSGTVSIAQGGTGQTTKTAAFDALAPTSSKGQLIVNNGTNNIALPASGTNGWVLTADSLGGNGVKWAAGLPINGTNNSTLRYDGSAWVENTAFTVTSAGTTSIAAGQAYTGAGAVTLSSGAATALTITGNAASTWSTTAGDLTINSGTTTPSALNLGTAGSNAINIGSAGVTTTNIGTLQTGDATTAGSFKIADGSANYITFNSPALTADYTLTLPVDDGASGQALTTNGTGVLSWTSLATNPMTTLGDIIYGGASGVPTRLGGSAGILKSTGAAAPTWATLTSSDVGLGNVTNDAQIPKAIGIAKGDIIAYSVSNTPIRLPVGTNGQVLTADSTQTSGLLWKNPENLIVADTLDFIHFDDAMELDTNTSINLSTFNLTINGTGTVGITPTSALTLTAGAASTWSTTAGALTIDSAAALNLGTVNATSVSIGNTTGASSLTLNSGTGAINIGTSIAKTITIGNSIGATALILDAGTGGVKIGDSTATPITNHYSATTTTNVASIGNNSCNTFNVTVTGAVSGDTAIATPDGTASGSGTLTNVTWSAYVSTANTVTVKVCKLGTGTADPVNQLWRVDVWKH